MRFHYIVDTHGSAWAEISCAEATVHMPASYLHDALRDIASATRALVEGANETRAVVVTEPGEHEVLFRREGDAVDIEVVWHDGYQGRPERKLMCRTRVAHVRGQVVSALRRILDEHGIEGYKKRSVKHEFPMSEYQRLRQLAK